ncbi:acyl-CoA dehydrogenase family protein [Phenylobacterium sp. SCN 70-31]|uniref:acyl-CoA dehydrogenase family protein n=1 Tax=Phenylobacterium sp. SCN 70-31 TaxID=1660129 RepID=UPI00086A9B88|nr:acyl-CoA dehydrogenase family protein [Phenylobacterium sp. SCN 70-31]ODT85708.1 MAG: acyl-CoA dehydrogenase [Phenylobacterium sp. SCN 70-31]
MNLDLSPDDERFRQEVRSYFETGYPQDILAKVRNGQRLTKADLRASEQALSAKGWLAPGWPEAYGGPGWTVTQRFIFDEELERVGAPNVSPMGLLYVAPVIMAFGTQAQKDRWLPDILASRVFWAQGYSEPGAGSDLASLRTAAVLDGDHYVVNGEKTWTSLGHHAEWIFCLVRTQTTERKQEGITFLCIDMATPGVQVTPIISIDGGHSLNRVSLQDVRVPVENRIGEEGRGWTYARHLLSHERTSYAHVAAKRRQMESLKAASAAAPWGDLLESQGGLRRRFAEVEIGLTALEMTTYRALAPLSSGQAPGDEASILKIHATETAQAITELFVNLAGDYGEPYFENRFREDWRAGLEDIPAFAAPGVAEYFQTRAQTIYGGTNEIQRNIIARQLGL